MGMYSGRMCYSYAFNLWVGVVVVLYVPMIMTLFAYLHTISICMPLFIYIGSAHILEGEEKIKERFLTWLYFCFKITLALEEFSK